MRTAVRCAGGMLVRGLWLNKASKPADAVADIAFLLFAGVFKSPQLWEKLTYVNGAGTSPFTNTLICNTDVSCSLWYVLHVQISWFIADHYQRNWRGASLRCTWVCLSIEGNQQGAIVSTYVSVVSDKDKEGLVTGEPTCCSDRFMAFCL